MSQGLSKVTSAYPELLPLILGCLAIVCGAALLVGFLTPLAGISTSVGYLVTGISQLLTSDPGGHSHGLNAFNLAVMSIALVLLGPGTFSLDARLFGRREIIIPEVRRPSR